MSKINRFGLAAVLCVSVIIALSGNGFAKDPDLTPEQVIADHLKSIGSASVLAGLKSRMFIGTTSANFIQGGQGSLNGTSMFVSEGHKLGIKLQFSDINYPGEYFAYDGKDVTVGYISPGQKSPIADFLFRYSGVIKEGLMGGVLSSSWPLLDYQNRQVDLKYKETTVEGRRLHEIEYIPKQTLRDMKIRLFFDPETFRHVRTEYKVRVKDDMSTGVAGGEYVERDFKIGSALHESIYTLVEKFGDFKKVGLFVLPHSYIINYSLEGQAGSFIAEWSVKAIEWGFNRDSDERLFRAQK